MGSKSKHCIDCNKLIWNGSIRCKSCAHKGTVVKFESKLTEIANKYNKTPKELLYQLYIVDNLTRQQIVSKLNYTPVSYFLKKFGIKKTGKWQRTKNVPSFGWIHQGVKTICINGKEVLEHQYIMEQHIGRPLKFDEIVHHINKNRLDNRIENLQLMTRSQHTTFHNTGKIRKGQKHTIKNNTTKHN
ncbi:MAG: HNH endonuclease signature motif containing protein [Candidatus Micrarchaeia archaeon]|jgi:hypothetical protein